MFISATGGRSPLFLMRQTEARHGATVTARVSFDRQRTFKVNPVYGSKREAKEAVSRLAIKGGILALIRPAAAAYDRPSRSKPSRPTPGYDPAAVGSSLTTRPTPYGPPIHFPGAYANQSAYNPPVPNPPVPTVSAPAYAPQSTPDAFFQQVNVQKTVPEAVHYLEQFCIARLGPGTKPQFDIRIKEQST
jgi:hypothetical protein